MGGSVALLVAARDERIGAVAAEGPYLDLEESLARHITLLYGVPTAPFHWAIAATYRLRFGVWPKRVSPLVRVAQIGPRPLLLINGSHDRRTPLEGARRLYAAARNPKELWVAEGAGHLEALELNPQAHLSRLTEFFARSLAPRGS